MASRNSTSRMSTSSRHSSASAASEPAYGPGESFDGNPFGKPGQDFRKNARDADEAKEVERLESERDARMRQAANLPEPSPIEEEEEAPPPPQERDIPERTAICEVKSCSVQ
mmetsp:Transcript_59385/g.134428  ORF Transcript_59385/g.134428 Transcript_59385/m.134428 type:complete len:112 (+) Transcript_59385:179-514(+)|eukprot:CAMPEP_0172630658 /NCGR_PEP_ID=MMETSP1068-20121228/174822_1 /TAXON_ID=35684 /ORGANISM="Pseudopedinella elastica, Strain CCMP716" /LENGTH=111 /DNA_ID=CAMNT_0013441563 /DNA_START=165 /DNA_END=500 /DNA_ORIENTATION=-